MRYVNSPLRDAGAAHDVVLIRVAQLLFGEGLSIATLEPAPHETIFFSRSFPAVLLLAVRYCRVTLALLQWQLVLLTSRL